MMPLSKRRHWSQRWASIEWGRCSWRGVLPCETICVPSLRILISICWWPSGSPLDQRQHQVLALPRARGSCHCGREGSVESRRRICLGDTTHAPFRGEVERIVSNFMASCASAVRSCVPAATDWHPGACSKTWPTRSWMCRRRATWMITPSVAEGRTMRRQTVKKPSADAAPGAGWNCALPIEIRPRFCITETRHETAQETASG